MHELAHYIRNCSTTNAPVAALKLDMSKAYDHMEWPFLETMLHKLGFSARWISSIMTSVTSASYTVKVNGVLSPVFSPSRGLRQGDLLSMYIFILCAQWLSCRILELVRTRAYEGVLISRCPHVFSLAIC